MSKNLHIVIVVFAVFQLAACVPADVRPGDDVLVDPSDDMTNPRFGRRTWVVYQADYSEENAESGPQRNHLAPGDAFRLLKRRNDFYLVPLQLLSRRWGENDFAPDRNRIRLIRSRTVRGMLCGKIVVPEHESRRSGHTTEHLLRISRADANEIDVDLDPYDEDKSLEAQCIAESGTHRGRAHASN